MEMLVVETIAKIRRAYFVQRKPIKAICRELGVSRKVVRKVIRSEATEFRYERETQPLPKMGPWSAELADQRGPFWMPIRGPIPMPIDKRHQLPFLFRLPIRWTTQRLS